MGKNYDIKALQVVELTPDDIINLQQICDEFNDFDGKAMIVLYDCNDEIECVAGQTDSYNSNDIVIVSKNMKESKELFITPEEIPYLLDRQIAERGYR